MNLISSCCAGLLPLTEFNRLAKMPPVEGGPDFGARCAEFREKVRLIGTYIDGYQPRRDQTIGHLLYLLTLFLSQIHHSAF